MSGHSKWSKIKHQKGTTDTARGKIFTKMASSIAIAIKDGGGNTDPNSNFHLRLAIEKAREVNMPRENIDRVIDRANKAGQADTMVRAVYEAFGPGGVGIIIEAATDNKQRTVSELKNILDRGGGTLAASGSVAHFFNFVGYIRIILSGKTYDNLFETAINGGAIDLSGEEEGGEVDVYTNPTDLHKIKEVLQTSGFTIKTSELIYRPITLTPVSKKDTANSLLKLLSTLEEADDIQRVFSNFDISEEILASSI
jgi:YebC/PmpR family DNA-binding regulatory protein